MLCDMYFAFSQNVAFYIIIYTRVKKQGIFLKQSVIFTLFLKNSALFESFDYFVNKSINNYFTGKVLRVHSYLVKYIKYNVILRKDVFMKLFAKKTTVPPKDKKNSVTVIIAAAGSGTRLGGVSKPLVRLCGKYAIEYSTEVFSACEAVTRIIISAKEEDIPQYEKLISDKGYTKVIGVVSGGSTRQESVSKAFRKAFDEMSTDFVAVHDAARPLITREEAEAAIQDARKYGCAVCASLCPDTVKRVGKGGFTCESIDRNGLYLIGTPQIFSADIYMTSLALAERDGFEATDDSSLAEYAGFKIKISETSRNNIKITYPEDIGLSEMILRSRNTEETL